MNCTALAAATSALLTKDSANSGRKMHSNCYRNDGSPTPAASGVHRSRAFTSPCPVQHRNVHDSKGVVVVNRCASRLADCQTTVLQQLSCAFGRKARPVILASADVRDMGNIVLTIRSISVPPLYPRLRASRCGMHPGPWQFS